MSSDRKYWATYFKGQSDAEVLSFLADAIESDARATVRDGRRSLHTDRRLAAERELRKRGFEVPGR